MINVIKHTISDFMVNLNLNHIFSENDRLDFQNNGLVVWPDFLTNDECKALVHEAKKIISQNPSHVSFESNGSDQRIYGINYLSHDFNLKSKCEKLDHLARGFYRKRNIEYFQLLGFITATENNLGSGSGWHRDSPFSHQFKFIIYLNDVDLDNGPFEYIMGSHLKEAVFDYSNKLGIGLAKYRFVDADIERLLDAGLYKKVSVTGRAGTVVLADTKGLHRGKPMIKGERWATTRYYYKDAIPKSMQALLPK